MLKYLIKKYLIEKFAFEYIKEDRRRNVDTIRLNLN